MRNLDMDDGVDLAILWQCLHMKKELLEGHQDWMDRHGITDEAGLNDYRQMKIDASNQANGFLQRKGKWVTKEKAEELDRKAAAMKAAKEAAALAAAEAKAKAKAGPQLVLQL
jgi:hypothetical protein